MVKQADILQVQSYNLVEEANISKTGWHGTPPPTLARKVIQELWRTGEIKKKLTGFALAPYSTLR